ncbi:MAG TPA: hypothetical protein VGX76_14470, partial [Pirellulales bacterium]|nr:hypothetical protein [Pirellulales bacterium]
MATVAVFSRSAEAELVRTQLTAAGIEAVVTPGEGTTPEGQVRVQVAAGDFERAMRLLFPVPEPARATSPPVGSWTCPKCGQTVFDFSSVCWLCGTARGSAPSAAAASVAAAPSIPIVPGAASQGTGTGVPDAAASNHAAPQSAGEPSAHEAPSDAVGSPSVEVPTTSAPDVRAPRFLRYGQHMPPPPSDTASGAQPVQAPASAPSNGPSAAPRFARLKPLDSPEEPPASQAVKGAASAELSAAAPNVAPPPGEPSSKSLPAAAVARTAELLPADFVIPVGPVSRVRSRVYTKQKEIESMTRWAWWTAVVGVLLCPASIYSVWVLLTL